MNCIQFLGWGESPLPVSQSSKLETLDIQKAVCHITWKPTKKKTQNSAILQACCGSKTFSTVFFTMTSFKAYTGVAALMKAYFFALPCYSVGFPLLFDQGQKLGLFIHKMP